MIIFSAGIAIYPVVAGGVTSDAEIIMRTAARMTASQRIFLNDAVVRMLATELTDRFIPPRPDSILRSIGGRSL